MGGLVVGLGGDSDGGDDGDDGGDDGDDGGGVVAAGV
ncbi:hypothetical protein Tco_1558191, partial [Tanacetum coccineum]